MPFSQSCQVRRVEEMRIAAEVCVSPAPCKRRNFLRKISEAVTEPHNVERNRPVGGWPPDGPVDGSVRPRFEGNEQ